jgi:heptaprenylglyceryl phosphate synthase
LGKFRQSNFENQSISGNPCFIGGSLVETNRIDELIIRLKQKINLPMVLFPGNPSQISKEADVILFLLYQEETQII